MRLASQEKKLAAFADLAQGREPLMPYAITKKEIAPAQVAAVEAEVDLPAVVAAIGEGFGMIMGVLGPAPAASTIHKGAYDDIAPAYHAMSEWMSGHGFEPAAPPCEVYLNEPTEVPVGEQLTEVLWGIREVAG